MVQEILGPPRQMASRVGTPLDTMLWGALGGGRDALRIGSLLLCLSSPGRQRTGFATLKASYLNTTASTIAHFHHHYKQFT